LAALVLPRYVLFPVLSDHNVPCGSAHRNDEASVLNGECVNSCNVGTDLPQVKHLVISQVDRLDQSTLSGEDCGWWLLVYQAHTTHGSL